MIDFKKRLSQKTLTRVIDPIALYDTLDRTSDKGPLRPAQEAILTDWHENHRKKRDNIVKLHTGQGKTLIGLLMLQSLMNENGGPTVYLCPNKHLVDQTYHQAKKFGISVCSIENNDLPEDFMDGKNIFLTTIQKLFNGFSKFGIDGSSFKLSNILLDDAHACVDAIKASLQIKISDENPEYKLLRDLFEQSLQHQGMGTFSNICFADPNVYLPVPYWAWQDKQEEVTKILARGREAKHIKFVWPLLKDSIQNCHCFFTGKHLEITPYLPPLIKFNSYSKADHRIFMSATVTDDAFLVKGLEISEGAIKEPLTYKKERWSGEKMILIPSLIDETLDRDRVVAAFAKEDSSRNGGTVVLTPSFKVAQHWKENGAVVAEGSDDIANQVSTLTNKNYSKVLTIANRYDGIDLPDDTCRLLILDGKPHSESLMDKYADDCRPKSETTAIRIARTIEQGLGRAVRGEKDYCAILIIGPHLVKSIRTQDSRRYFSAQTRAQVEIGIETANMGKEEVGNDNESMEVLKGLIDQIKKRDDGWKRFYAEQMQEIIPDPPNDKYLSIFKAELEAEYLFMKGDIESAVNIIQKIIDKSTEKEEKGWYLQEIARYTYCKSETESNKFQISAHNSNQYLLKPRDGLIYKRLQTISQKRTENIIEWVKKHDSAENLII
jgi:replicative superfamily II helicase